MKTVTYQKLSVPFFGNIFFSVPNPIVFLNLSLSNRILFVRHLSQKWNFEACHHLTFVVPALSFYFKLLFFSTKGEDVKVPLLGNFSPFSSHQSLLFFPSVPILKRELSL